MAAADGANLERYEGLVGGGRPQLDEAAVTTLSTTN
jgi:hypothetical protein